MEKETISSKCFCIKGIRIGASNDSLLALQKYSDLL